MKYVSDKITQSQKRTKNVLWSIFRMMAGDLDKI